MEGTIIATFMVYLVAMLAIGLYAYKQTLDAKDYFLGGRRLGPWPAASDMSGCRFTWLCLCCRP
tara:strand:- start:2003 stop:2194 length:192 start_codon:yes stop_codon:yes gene_type:complete